LCELAREVAVTARGSRTRVVVNDRADVALAAGCDGVHLRGDGPPVARVRPLGAGHDATWMVGRSVHTLEEARAHAGADYLLFGAVFESGPKAGRGVEALKQVAEAVPGDVIAIGGVTVPRAAQCMAAGAAGVAAIRLFLPPGRAADAVGITTAVARLRVAFDAAATGHLE
jgi:thiamine-phosphate diphosphorylase